MNKAGLLLFVLLAGIFLLGSKAQTEFLGGIGVMPFMKFCKYFGYPVEQHFITTEDGYILTFFRIQAKHQTQMKSGLPVVYLQHGLLDSSDTWIVNDEDKAPGFVLANKGYDVWLGNSRGNKHSRNHTYLKTNSPQFWQFSWQNMSKYDLPAAFEYIFKHTQQKINYIGHSQGSIIMFAALSEQDPTILKYINKFLAVGPVAWVGNITSGVFEWMARSKYFAPFLEALRVKKFMEPNLFLNEFSFELCHYSKFVCKELIGMLTNTHPEVDNSARFDVILGHEPGGTSLWNMLHWRHEILNDCFCKFDYGEAGNMFHYGQPTPPNYDISKINIPVYLFAGEYDKLADPVDVEYLKSQLTGVPKLYYKSYEFGHCTFVWGKNVTAFFNDMLNVLQGEESVISI